MATKPDTVTVLNWVGVDERLPEPMEEVLVYIDGHRSPLWKNNYLLIAFRDMDGNWREERHPSWQDVAPLSGVIFWAKLYD